MTMVQRRFDDIELGQALPLTDLGRLEADASFSTLIERFVSGWIGQAAAVVALKTGDQDCIRSGERLSLGGRVYARQRSAHHLHVAVIGHDSQGARFNGMVRVELP